MGRKVMTFIAGFGLTITGVTLIYRQWGAVVVLFKGTIGALLAVGGLVVLFASSF